MRAVRVGLVVVGCGLAAFGIVALLQRLSLPQLLWLLVWLAATVAVHDGVLVPVLQGARMRLRRAGRRWPRGVVATIEFGFAIVAGLALFVLPEIWAQQRGNANPTILQGDYAMRLLVAVLVVALAVLIVARILTRRSRG